MAIPHVSSRLDLFCVQSLNPAVSLSCSPLVVPAFEHHIVQDGAPQEPDSEVPEHYGVAECVVGCIFGSIHIRRHDPV